MLTSVYTFIFEGLFWGYYDYYIIVYILCYSKPDLMAGTCDDLSQNLPYI